MGNSYPQHLGIVVPKMFNTRVQRTIRYPCQDFPSGYPVTSLQESIRVTTSKTDNSMTMRFFDAFGTEYLVLNVYGMPLEILVEDHAKATPTKQTKGRRQPLRSKRSGSGRTARNAVHRGSSRGRDIVSQSGTKR
jgi:hypothetical protein